MADVELIIKLDTETYKAACDLGVSYFETGMRSGKTLLSKLAFAIRKGTLLSNFGTYIAGYMDATKTLESKAGGEKT